MNKQLACFPLSQSPMMFALCLQLRWLCALLGEHQKYLSTESVMCCFQCADMLSLQVDEAVGRYDCAAVATLVKEGRLTGTACLFPVSL